MYRCAISALALLVLTAAAAPAESQTQRRFPADALRGELVVGVAPEAQINEQTARLAPGARIRAENNLLVLPSSLSGNRLLVHYTIDSHGLLKDIWILNASERERQPWPQTPEQAARWHFDIGAQVWTER